MLGNDNSMELNDGSLGIQAQGDINIKNGLSVSDVTALFEVLFQNQFPRIQEIAKNQAIKNGKFFESAVIQELHENSERIVIEKFGDPDVQAMLTDALTSCGRKAEKAHPDLLSKLVVEKVSSGNSELKDIVVTEAVTVVPRLTGPQLSLILIVFIMKDIEINDHKFNLIYTVEKLHSAVEGLLSNGFKLSMANLIHLTYSGACDYNNFMSIDPYDSYFEKYNGLGAGSIQELKERLKILSPATSRFLDNFNSSNYGGLNLTSVGQAIAITMLKPYCPGLDYNTWLK
ncbi:LPO_1073/Vpar_1526 family protein [Lonsdalea quercina]|uniref:LPO_1073/Vpar_1526 family protein n=1 Tax=Lonsdalea quercina TaxID=71657 RepID=UPI003976C213